MMYSNKYIEMTGETIIKKNKQKCCKVKYLRKIKRLVSTKHFKNDSVSYDSIQDSLKNSLSLSLVLQPGVSVSGCPPTAAVRKQQGLAWSRNFVLPPRCVRWLMERRKAGNTALAAQK